MSDEIHYNHDRPLEDFQKEIDKLRLAGYNPIAVTQMLFEDTFVFETDEEARRGFEQFEKAHWPIEGGEWKETTEEEAEEIEKKSIVGWWYGKEEFLKEVDDYENRSKFGEGCKVRIYWL